MSTNELQRIFNLQPNTPGRLLLPAVQGVMDVSQQWPLPYQLNPQDYAAAGGTNTKVLAEPKPNFHQLVVHSYFTTSVAGAGKASVLFMTNTKNTGATANITLQRVQLDVLTQVPLIGGSFFQNGVNIFLQGLPAIYVPFPFRLSHSFTAAAGGEAVTLRTMVLQLPASQPFTSLLALQ